MKKMKHHLGHGHKEGKGAAHGGGNLSLPKATQAVTVKPAKDRMAANVSNHMGTKQMGPKQEIETTGGNGNKRFKSDY